MYADGWVTTRMGNQRIKVFAPHGEGGDNPLSDIGYLDQRWVKDALAAQLVRQIDAMNYEIISSEGHCAVYDQEHQVNTLEVNSSYDRTDNTLNACVEFYDNE